MNMEMIMTEIPETCEHCEGVHPLPLIHLPDLDLHICQSCMVKDFTACETCGAIVQVEDLDSRLLCAATRLDPPEYGDACQFCSPGEGDDGPYDTLEERDEARGDW
jgi:hypothetical protein